MFFIEHVKIFKAIPIDRKRFKSSFFKNFTDNLSDYPCLCNSFQFCNFVDKILGLLITGYLNDAKHLSLKLHNSYRIKYITVNYNDIDHILILKQMGMLFIDILMMSYILIQIIQIKYYPSFSSISLYNSYKIL